MFAVEEPVMRVESGVEQVKAIELAEYNCIEYIIHSLRILGVRRLNLLEAGEGAVVVEIVEVIVSLSDLRREIDGVGVGGGIVGIGDDWRCQQKREEKEA